MRPVVPYSAYDLFHVDPRYARTPEAADAEFASFVDDLRRRGMRLCVDLVFNHIGINSKLAIEHPEWLETNPDEEDGIQRAGWSDGTTFHKWTDLAKLNYRNPVEAERDALFESHGSVRAALGCDGCHDGRTRSPRQSALQRLRVHDSVSRSAPL